MKKLLIAATLILSSFAFAGPEDRMNYTCYVSMAKVPNFIPSTFCFESAQLDLTSEKLLLNGYASNLPSTINLDLMTRKNEDFYSFKARAVIANKWESGCGEGEFAELFISGISSAIDGEIDGTNLKMTVKYEQTNDTCHSQPQSDEIEYTLVK